MKLKELWAKNAYENEFPDGSILQDKVFETWWLDGFNFARAEIQRALRSTRSQVLDVTKVGEQDVEITD